MQLIELWKRYENRYAYVWYVNKRKNFIEKEKIK